jgi:hypothetical protein
MVLRFPYQLPLFIFSPVIAWQFANGARIIYDGGCFETLIQAKGQIFSMVP